MKTFEEKLTAWIDGELTGPELAEFERELENHPEAFAERETALELGNLLRTHLSAPPLRNGDFFNLQILREIQDSEPEALHSPRRFTFWTLPRMACSGAALLLLATAFYFAAVPNTRRQIRHNEQYVSNILNARSDDPSITATSFHSKEENVNVVWLDGMSYIPPDHKLK